MSLKLALSALALAVMASVSPVHAQSAKPLLSPSDTSLPPFSMSDLGGGLKGLTIDLAAALSREMGQTIAIDPAQWSAALPGLSSGKYDLLMPPVNVTPERASMLLFSEPYLENDFLFLTRKNAPDVTDPSEFKDKTIATPTRARRSRPGPRTTPRSTASRSTSTAPAPMPSRPCNRAAPSPRSRASRPARGWHRTTPP